MIGTLVFIAAGLSSQAGVTPAAAPGRASAAAMVRTVKDAGGWRLQVDGRDFMVLGMNWDYFPVGTNYSYDFWGKPDEFIQVALDREMSLMRDMGANSIRAYIGMPPKWIKYIYEKYGIWTILNHPMARYGHMVDGVYISPTNYADPRLRQILKEEIQQLVLQYRDTPGLLMWLLGNENNYGLYWASAEIENLPDRNKEDARATYLYTLYGELTDVIHQLDDRHPVAMANGDLQFIDLIAQHAGNIDIMGSNVYRGPSSGDLFAVVAEKLDKPFVYTEFGSDAYHALEKREAHLEQSEVLRSLWQEIYEQSHGKGLVGNSIGGMTFQWSDGWWKYRQDENLSVQDTTASWANAAYRFDFEEGKNNMNEEWFGVCAKGRTDSRGHYPLFPRTAYYVLQKGYELDPYAPLTDLARIREHWGSIRPERLSTHYLVTSLGEKVRELGMVQAINLTMQFETFTTGGSRLTEPERATDRFDHLQSFYVDVGIKPTENIRGRLSLNVLGNVAANPINEIFYENRALPQEVLAPFGRSVVVGDLERLAVYQADFDWEEDWFDLRGFYRVGHYHWAYEGDFFGIYQEANYQPAVDMFNANAPNGFEFVGKKLLKGLKIAAGPELTWGANPTIIAKYHREYGPFAFSFMHQEDIAQRANAPTSSVIPLPRTRKTSLYLAYKLGDLKLEAGGLMAGTDRLGRSFTVVREASGDSGYLGSGFDVFDGTIDYNDTFGAKAKISYTRNNLNLYVQGNYRGLVADGGYDQTITFTGWALKDTGYGNNYHVLAGGAYNIGPLQFAPNFMYQVPLEGPLPSVPDLFDRDSGRYFSGVRPRNLLQDPFWVRENRETIGAELLIGYDPTGATWAWAWDNVVREDAPFAGFLTFVYKVLPTSQDAVVAVAEEGFLFAFPGAPPAQDLYEVRGRMIFNPDSQTHIVIDGYGGIGQARGDDDRLITRGGGFFRVTHRQFDLGGFVKVNDWGPFDYHQDFNLTFPLQTSLNLSYAATTPEWFVRAYTRLGIAGQFRLLDEFSNRFLVDENNPDALGTEWEVRTYVHITL